MIESHPQGVDHKTNEEELEAHFQDGLSDEKEIMLIGVHEGIGIQMGCPMGDDGNPSTEVYENYI